MLVAERDPFHPGADNAAVRRAGAAARMARVYSVLQICGTLLAVPVGLASAYSVYRANFSVETTCQNLRTNIVAMLDRGVDPNARHMLVRRDVEEFQRTCGGVDPDATAAFKTLLAIDKKVPTTIPQSATPSVAAVVPKVDFAPKADAEPKIEAKADAKGDSKPEAKAETVIRKIDMHPAVAAKQPAAAAVEAKISPRDAAMSDAAWLGAVRQALVKNTADAPAKAVAPAGVASPAAVAVAAPIAPPSLEKRSLGELRTTLPGSPPQAPAAEPISLAAPAPAAAPILPPPMPVANAPTPQVDDGHPVPPEAIPDSNPAEADRAAHRSRIGTLISKIPFVGSALEK